MAKYTQLKTLFTDIANAIRNKTESEEPINAQDFPDKINEIQAGSQGSMGYTLVTNEPTIATYTTESL